MIKPIEDFVEEKLLGEAKRTALCFIDFLRMNHLEFYKDNSGYWEDKIYYWVKQGEACLCFIAINNPDEPQNLWTVWSDNSSVYEADILEEDIKCTAWKYIDFCASCGSCSRGRRKTIFGKEFDGVCGCTFRVDNPTAEDLPFLKKMIELCTNR